MANYLVMWSGGIDSTYILAKLLTSSLHRVHAHHINIINREGRAEVEHDACNKIANELLKIRPFTRSTSGVDHSQYKNLIYDMAITCFEAGSVSKNMAQNGHAIDKWTIGTHKAEGHWKERFKVIEGATRAACWPMDAPEFELQEMVSKQEEVSFLKKIGILDMCWYCRFPANGNVCGKCKTCLEVKECQNGI